MISGFFFLKHAFSVFISDANFSIFEDSVRLIQSSLCARFVHFSNSTGLAIVALTEIRQECVFPKKNCHKLLH